MRLFKSWSYQIPGYEHSNLRIKFSVNQMGGLYIEVLPTVVGDDSVQLLPVGREQLDHCIIDSLCDLMFDLMDQGKTSFTLH